MNSDFNSISKQEQDYLDNNYNKNVPLIDYNGRMNKICHYMEKCLKQTKSIAHTPSYILELMQFDSDRQFKDKDVNIMIDYYELYMTNKSRDNKLPRSKNKKKFGSNEDIQLSADKEIRELSFDQFCSYLRKRYHKYN